MSRLAGKITLVSGAARGIGEAIARAFLAEGALVCVTGSELNIDGGLLAGSAATP